MDKDKALKRLSALEAEAQELRKIIEEPQKITDRVKSYEDACKILKVYVDENLVKVSSELDRDSKSIKAYAKLIIIVRALNEGWTPDWNNSNQYKYYPYWDMRSGFVFHCVNCSYLIAHVGSRLCFKSEELAKYCGKQFESIYKDYLTI